MNPPTGFPTLAELDLGDAIQPMPLRNFIEPLVPARGSGEPMPRAPEPAT